MKQRLKTIILENQSFEIGNYVARKHVEVPLNSSIVISIIGPRRSGKTYLLYHIIQELKNSGTPPEHIVFINFEDERLTIRQEDLDLIIQAYQELFPDTNLAEVYFFFDEIQNVKGWEKFVRRLYDTKSKNIYITGSNSKLLGSEIATELRGRTLSYTVYPYSFSEFVSAQNVAINVKTQTGKAKMVNLAEKFLFEGGFPELTKFDKSFKIKLLQQYFNVMIYRDIIERYAITNPEVLKFFIKKVFAAITVPFSVNKAYYDLKSMGYKVSNKYLYEYMDHCNAVFLTKSISKFSSSEIKQAKSDKKVYVSDNGLLSAIDFQISENRGKLLENMVAMEFIKREKTLLYFKEQCECDFIVKDNDTFLAIQVSWSIADKDTKHRELKGLLQACRILGNSEGTIITFDEEMEFESDNVIVHAIPFYKYFA